MITGKQTLQALREAVAERGRDYVDPASGAACDRECAYTHDGQPSCIVGTALARLGVPVDTLIEMDDRIDVSIGSIIADGALPLELSEISRRLLIKAQTKQDRGWSWGRVLDSLDSPQVH